MRHLPVERILACSKCKYTRRHTHTRTHVRTHARAHTQFPGTAVAGRCPVLEWFCSRERSCPQPINQTLQATLLLSPFIHSPNTRACRHTHMYTPRRSSTAILMHLLTFVNPPSSFFSTYTECQLPISGLIYSPPLHI